MSNKAKKIPRHEWAYGKFVDEMIKYAEKNDLMDDITDEQMRAEFNMPEIKDPMMNALNVILWHQDELATAGRVTAFREVQEMILSINHCQTGDQLGETAGNIFDGVTELIKVEKTSNELLSDKDLKEIVGDDDEATPDEIADMKKVLDE